MTNSSPGEDLRGTGIVTTTLEAVSEWARSRSMWQLAFGTACCALEMMATNASLIDLDRFGILPRTSPRQADFIIFSGTITFKLVPVIERIWDQMPDPKWAIAMGNCSTSGGIFYHDSYSVLKGVDRIVPVDVYISGCPPRPEALVDGLLELQRKIAAGRDEICGHLLRKSRKLRQPPWIVCNHAKESPD